MRPRSPRLALLLGTAVWLAAGCGGPRYARETVFEDGSITVLLRQQLAGGDPVPREFSHPTVIAPVRLAHVLARVDVRTTDDEKSVRKPAIDAEQLYPLSEQVAAALSRATPDQEIVVLAVRREARLGIFNQDYLSSFVAYVRGELLYLHFAQVDWPVPKAPDQGGATELPEPWEREEPGGFRVLASESMTSVGARGLAVAWQDPVFRRPGTVRVGPGGKVSRKTILLESEEPPAEDPGTAEALPADLSPEALRTLADLEEERRNGQISEAEYQGRRRELLRAGPE